MAKDIASNENVVKLQNVLRAGQAGRIASFFDGMTEKERAALVPVCLDWQKQIRDFVGGSRWQENEKRFRQFIGDAKAYPRDYLYLANLVILACADFSTIKKALRPTGGDPLFNLSAKTESVLRSRKPAWTVDFLEWYMLLPDNWQAVNVHWLIYRRFVAEGWLSPSMTDHWIRFMFSCLEDRTHSWPGIGQKGIPLTDQLRADRSLIENELWRIFEIASFPNNWSYTNIDKSGAWKHVFFTLIQDGTYDKFRVIDACLQALNRPFTDNQGKWFVQLLERIPLSDAELLENAEKLLHLLELTSPTAQNRGVELLERIAKTKKYPLEKILEYVPLILQSPKKATAKKGIALLDPALKDPDAVLKNKAMAILLLGLEHEEADIQRLSLDLLLKHGNVGNPEIKEEIGRLIPALAPSVAKRLEEHFVSSGTGIKASAKESKSVKTIRPKESKRKKIVPVQNFDELLSLASRLLENPDDADEIERFLDGMARLGSKKPKDFEAKTSALMLQAQKKLGNRHETVDGEKIFHLTVPDPFQGCDIQTDFRYLIAAWITGEVPELKNRRMKIGDRIYKNVYHESPGVPATELFSARMKSVAGIVASGKSVQLLCTPTFHGGWIDPETFVRRVIAAETAKVQDDEHDRVLALLRLTPEGREAALKLIETKISKRSEYINAVRYALGGKGIKVGKTAHYWIAAARCRNPLENDPNIEKVFPDYGPDAGIAATYQLKRGVDKIYSRNKIQVECLPKRKVSKIDLTFFPTVGLHVAVGFVQGEEPGQFPWTLTIWPQNLDPAIAASLDAHSGNIDNAQTDAGFRHALAALALPSVPLHDIDISALFTALAMKCPVVHTTATDTLIAVIGDGRITADQAAKPVVDLLALEFLTLSRWIKPLKIIAEQSDLHAEVIRSLLERLIHSIPAKEIGGFIELLYELCVSLDRRISREYRQAVEGFKDSGKAAKLAKKLLEL